MFDLWKWTADHIGSDGTRNVHPLHTWAQFHKAV